MIRHENALAFGAIAALGLFTAVALLGLGRGTNFFQDDWYILLGRRGVSLDTLLKPHNEHLSLVPVLAFKVMLQTVGWGSFLPYRIVAVGVHILTCVLLFLVIRRHVAPATAALLTAPVFLLGQGYNALLAPFQATLAASMAAGLGALLALDRRTRAGDLVACGLMVLSLACSGLGVAWLIVVTLDVLLRPDRFKRLWIFAVPLLLYGAWAVAYMPGGETQPLGAAAAFVFNAAAAALSGYTGLGKDFGPALLVAGLVAAGLVIARRGGVPIRTVALIAAAAAFWFGAGMRRVPSEASASRYLVPGAIFLVAAVAPLLSARRPSFQLLTAGAAAVLAAVVMGWTPLVAGRNALRASAEATGARLAAIELVRDRADPWFEPDPILMADIFAFQYLDAEEDFRGSPATPIGELRKQTTDARAAFDQALIGVQRIAPTASIGAVAARRPDVRDGATSEARPGCIGLDEGPVALVSGPGGFRIQAGRNGEATIKLSRLAPEAVSPWTTKVAAGATADLRFQPDPLPDPWRAVVEGPRGTLACRLTA